MVLARPLARGGVRSKAERAQLDAAAERYAKFLGLRRV
jgi:hypothetical protein